MPSLIETSILVRLANDTDTLYDVATQAIASLRRVGESLHMTPQNIVEFRNVATRPVDVNGLGDKPEIAEEKIALFESMFDMLPENDQIYPAWKALVKAGGIIGKQVHDARLVAICQVYGITQVVTFNTQHFIRLVSFVPRLMVIDPRTV